jgi:DNA-binding response OmpR family regulator
MDAPRLLVIAPDGDLRRSLTFALEAEGYAVTALADADSAPVVGSAHYNCTIIDQAALAGTEAAIRAFCAAAKPVVLLSNTPVGWLPADGVSVVEKPMLGESLSQAVRGALGRTTTAAPPK